MKDYNIDFLPIPGDIINHSELGKVKVLKIIGLDIYGGPAEYEIENKNGKSFPITFDELTDMIGYGEISDVPQTLKNSFDFQLVNQEISEARLYRTTNGFKNLTGRDIADLLYLHTLTLYMMLQDDSLEDYAVGYAKQTTQYGHFTLMRTHATDLYMLAYAVKNPDNRYISFKNNRSSRKFLEKLNFGTMPTRQFHFFISRIGKRGDKRNEALSFFMRLERQLKITDGRYRGYRRMVLSWGKLKYHSKQLVVSKLTQEIRRLGRGSELMSPMTSMNKDRGLRVSSDYKEPRTSLTRRVAGTAAGAVVGRYAGKKIAQKTGANVDKYKKVGTGLGAVAGYWASGRKKQ